MTTYLPEYAYFTNKYDMDKAVKQHISANWNELNKTDRAVLDMIRRYSVKYCACRLKHETIEKAVGKSNGTVRRILRKLEQLGIIERVHYIRPVMSGLGANIYAIKPYNEKTNSPEQTEKPIVNEPQPELSTSIEPSISSQQTYPEEHKHTTVFGRMKTILSSTIGDNSCARMIYGVYRHQSLQKLKFQIYADGGELFEDLAIQALHISVQATKRKQIRNIPGYYSGVLRELINKALFSEPFMYYDEPVEFFFIDEQGDRCFT